MTDHQYILKDTYDKLAAFVSAGDNDGARNLVKDRFSILPQEVQGEILTVLLAEAIEMQAQELDETITIQEEGIAALKALEELKMAIR